MNPIINNKFILEKFPGKGGWTYAVIPPLATKQKTHFGTLKVSGTIDDFEVKNFSLLSMGKGKLFMPVKAEIRKKIGKQEGDWVQLILYADEPIDNIKEEFMLCLKEDSMAEQTFNTCTREQQQAFIDWIYASKSDEMKVERMAKTLDLLARGIVKSV